MPASLDTIASAPASLALPARRARNLTRAMSYGFTGVTLLALAFMLAVFVVESLPVWNHSGFGYLTGTTWFSRRQQFGAAPMIFGTVAVSAVALALAAPVGVGAAVFTAEFLPPRVRLVVKVAIELLAGIPSVVYGLLGILVLRTVVADGLAKVGVDMLYGGDSLLTAGVLLAFMVLPTVMTLSDDALRGVPAAQRQAARGLGLTRAQVALHVGLPQARRGMVAAVLLGLGRALGETIAVFCVVGKRDNQWPTHLFSIDALVSPGQTLTSKLGGSETPEAYGSPLFWAAIVGLGLVLFLVVGAITLVGAWLEGREEARA